MQTITTIGLDTQTLLALVPLNIFDAIHHLLGRERIVNQQ